MSYRDKQLEKRANKERQRKVYSLVSEDLIVGKIKKAVCWGVFAEQRAFVGYTDSRKEHNGHYA